MSLLGNPEDDGTIDHLKLHKDLSWVARTLAALIVVGFLGGVWAATLASDVRNNAAALEGKASAEQVESLAKTLDRIEGKIDEQGKEQKTISNSVIRLETKVQRLEEDRS